jgi:catechol 2,3-dioxygenase-like lactoylglutathione lyase family enzyme
MITGAHTIIYSSNPEADRAFFRDVLGLKYVDSGEGWLIFALPPAELAVHPAEQGGRHELFLLCDDVEAFVLEMMQQGVGCTPIQNQDWGRLTAITLPGGGRFGVYQPTHAQP